jgi:hypothetical protein
MTYPEPGDAVDGGTKRSKLRQMKRFRRTVIVAALTTFGCERAKSPPPVDSSIVHATGTPDTATSTPSRNWDPSAGPLLLVAAESPDQAFVVLPDAANASAALASLPHPASVTLFGRSGTVQTAELPNVSDTSACSLATLSAAPPPRPWNVGFIGGVVAPLPLDSVEVLSHADSTRAVTVLNRLASALPNDPAGRFSGLPFVVKSIWRLTLPTGESVLVGTLARQINQEATPLQEHTLLLAERARKAPDTAFTTAYSERSYGEEETIESRDIVAAVLLGQSRIPAIVLARDFGDSNAYALLERESDGRWRARWASARRRC